VGLAEPVDTSARRILDAIGRRSVRKIVASPLRRAHDTASHMARMMNLPLTVEPRIMELDFGRWEGVAWRNIPRSELDAWAADPTAYRCGGGETVQELHDRVAAVWQEAAYNQTPELWITHAGPLRCLTALATGTNYAASLATSIGFCSVHDVTPRSQPKAPAPSGEPFGN
jgi:alpha-ribazole phosphatase